MYRLATLVAITVLLVSCAADPDSDDGGGDSDTGDEFEAQVMCEDFVEDRLKSPSTAEFEVVDREHVRGQVWRITGTVDSENSFGAMVRNDFSCTVRYVGDDRWRLQNLAGLTN